MSGPAQLRVPREHGAVLAVPPLTEVGRLLETNSRRLHFNHPWQDLRDAARREVIAAASAYLTRLGEPLPELKPGFILVAGHQPELFHPGVWLKNFALAGLAQSHGGMALNLIVDNDGIKSPSLLVPRVRTPLPPIDEFRSHVEPIAIDAIAPGVPHEEWNVRDERLFDSLPQRAALDWPFTTLLPMFWEQVRKVAQRTRSAPARLTGGRRAVERQWGCHNLELPVSELCRMPSFSRFVFNLLSDLQRFHTVYNESLHEYRRERRIKSRNHPAPDLGVDGEWREAPLWAWHAGESRRGRVFARLTRGGSLELRALGRIWPVDHGGLVESGIEQIATRLEEAGLKIRSRALTTTLFARLFVADLFAHGIGGARYDEVTDAIIRRYYAIDPPRYLILSGTLLLPFPHYPASADDCRLLAALVRDIRYNPQRHIDDCQAADEFLRRRAELVNSSPTDAEKSHRRWRELQDVTAALQPFVAGSGARVSTELQRRRHEVAANAVLRRRDYAFCLYPEDVIRPFCTRLLAGS